MISPILRFDAPLAGASVLAFWRSVASQLATFGTRSSGCGSRWSPWQESNLHLALRRHLFYPLNYRERIATTGRTGPLICDCRAEMTPQALAFSAMQARARV